MSRKLDLFSGNDVRKKVYFCMSPARIFSSSFYCIIYQDLYKCELSLLKLIDSSF